MINQNNSIKEMFTKQKVLETKLKHLENNHKNKVDELKQEICILKTKTEKLLNTPTDNVEDVPTIVVEEVKGTNITIVKTKAENNPPKTLTTSKDTDEENIV